MVPEDESQTSYSVPPKITGQRIFNRKGTAERNNSRLELVANILCRCKVENNLSRNTILELTNFLLDRWHDLQFEVLKEFFDKLPDWFEYDPRFEEKLNKLHDHPERAFRGCAPNFIYITKRKAV